ncbi:MAG TPA: TetR/AcrR family transcriptional regulator [Thermoleophilia bacterium]|nr:TetR/AcrR family transcriptional regulator [Thermoleophilia bacterium]
MSEDRSDPTEPPGAGAGPGGHVPPADLPPTARRLLAAAQDILAERGYAELTMTAISQVSGVNRALVSYYFGGKAGLLAALVDTLFQDPDVGLVEEIRATEAGAKRVESFLDWQRRVSGRDRTNRMLYELLPHALRDPEVRARFAEEYRVYRDVDAECLSGAPRELDEQELEALAAVTIAVVEGLGIQRALDPDGFDHEAAWRAWRDLIGSYLTLPGRPEGRDDAGA